MATFPSPARALLLACCALAPCAVAAPSTFAPVIGSALLCRSHLDNNYFYDYLTTAFGPAYKHEGGAYWFKADAALWGTAVTDVMVSDDSSELVFIAATTDSSPEDLHTAIRSSVGVSYRAQDASAFPVLESLPGSRIVYNNDKSKIYCAKFKPQMAVR